TEESDVAAPRSAGLIAVVMVATSLVAEASAAEAGAKVAVGATNETEAQRSEQDPNTLLELRRQAQKATADIEAATRALVNRQKALEESQKKLAAKLNQLQQANRELARMREPLSELVQSLYQVPTIGGLSSFMSGNEQASLRAMSDATHLGAARNQMLEESGKAF